MKKVPYGTLFCFSQKNKKIKSYQYDLIEIIIKCKLISIKKSFSGQRFVFVSLLAAVLFLPSFKVKAANSPLEDLVKISKEKISGSKKITIENPSTFVLEETKKPTLIEQINEAYLRTPSAVSDPKKIEEAAEFASNATGVRKNFIIGLLAVESDLGRNPGKCTYQEVEDGARIAHQKGRLSAKAWKTFNKRREIIKDVAKDLGYDYEKLSVSCNPGAAYAGTGGAMGIPQFMPDTWMEYKDRISAVVGKENPDPWNEKDAAVAVALKLSDVAGVTSHSRLAERNAAKMYLSGNTSSRYDWYANQILYWAENYRELIG